MACALAYAATTSIMLYMCACLESAAQPYYPLGALWITVQPFLASIPRLGVGLGLSTRAEGLFVQAAEFEDSLAGRIQKVWRHLFLH